MVGNQNIVLSYLLLHHLWYWIAYAYLDGELHVKVSIAMDAIIRDLTKKRKAMPAYLGTPTDAHVIPQDAHDQAEKLYEEWSLTNILLKFSPFNLPISPYLVSME